MTDVLIFEIMKDDFIQLLAALAAASSAACSCTSCNCTAVAQMLQCRQHGNPNDEKKGWSKEEHGIFSAGQKMRSHE